uniref:Uncharacterized protein n=1 Tax=Cannabis sativa TaxID=3483 RepID=A0A803P484_CANSA
MGDLWQLLRPTGRCFSTSRCLPVVTPGRSSSNAPSSTVVLMGEEEEVEEGEVEDPSALGVAKEQMWWSLLSRTKGTLGQTATRDSLEAEEYNVPHGIVLTQFSG